MAKRIKRKETKLFFDSLKHLKNNLTNLIFYEMKTLQKSKSVEEYLSLKPVNYKSKYPDMKKFGLIDYNKPSDNEFDFTDLGFKIYTINEEVSTDYRSFSDQKLKSIHHNIIINNLSDSEKIKFQRSLVELIISYYDTADALRPYLLMIKFLKKHNIMILSDNILLDILSQKKQDILLGDYKQNSFNKLNASLQEEIRRPRSYILDTLIISGIIDERRNVICDFDLIEEIEENLIDHFYKDFDEETTQERPNKEQSDFREQVLNAYQYKCAVTGKCIKIKDLFGDYKYLIEAAHIIPYSEGGSFSVTNGIALSYQIHRLFDRKLLFFEYNNNDELVVKISRNKRIQDDGILAKLNNSIVKLPKNSSYRPDIDALEYRKKRHVM